MALVEDAARRLAVHNDDTPADLARFDPLSAHTPHLSAQNLFAEGQRRHFLAIASLAAAMILLAPLLAIRVVLAATTAVFAALIVLRYCAAALPRKRTPPTTAPISLPLYTLLCPVYRETRALPGLVDALDRLDYPKEKLDVIILTEPDDPGTGDVARQAASTRGWIRVLEAPRAGPKTKPKALNAGLAQARGVLLTVYDAEDRPHPTQLRAAAAAFEAADDTLVCLQAPLAAYNGGEGWIAGQFALEYRIQFGYVLPLMARLGWPILLGGTSNHFRTDALRRHFGWDSYNVTEDADLGLRLARAGLRTGMIAPPTFEEAPIRFRAWRRQRTRWIKGHIVTWLVHMRRPRTLVRELGLWRFAGMQLTLGGGLLSSFLHAPLIMTAFLASAITKDGWQDVAAIGATGYGAAFVCALRAAIGDRDARIILRAFTAPLYWPAQSLAALAALRELRTSPHLWAKTEHGLTTQTAPPMVAPE